jgi:phosphoribosyl-dephospho-CoA transferase
MYKYTSDWLAPARVFNSFIRMLKSVLLYIYRNNSIDRCIHIEVVELSKEIIVFSSRTFQSTNGARCYICAEAT